jgi:DNA-binding NarL/FixJ family response regulator
MQIQNVHGALRVLCEQEGVADRHALAAKLGASCSPPLNQQERAAKRRFVIREMLMEGKSWKEIGEELGIDEVTIRRDTQTLYAEYGVSGSGKNARRALAEKIGRELPKGRVEKLRERIGELREAGLSRKEIAREVGRSIYVVDWHLKRMRRGQKVQDGIACG